MEFLYLAQASVNVGMKVSLDYLSLTPWVSTRGSFCPAEFLLGTIFFRIPAVYCGGEGMEN